MDDSEKRSAILKGALAGVAAGLVGSVAVTLFQRNARKLVGDRNEDDSSTRKAASSSRSNAMAKETPKQKRIVERVMHEFKEGELESGSGRKVKNAKQAIAIGLSEAGASNRKSPAQNRKNLKRTEKGGGDAGESKEALYAEAKKRDIPGRSKMGKAALERALGR